MTTISHPLDFEKEIVSLVGELDSIKEKIAAGDLTLRDDFDRLEAKIRKVRQDTYGKLTSIQRVQLSRHFDRPFSLDLIPLVFESFTELHGDRLYRDDPAIVGGLARFDGQGVMICGHQRGRSTAERVHRNFGMPQPEGYRKALRLFRLAEKFKIPLITLIDTQGAYPGIEAEERGQAEAIARNLLVLSELRTPVISVVIGEGGSGGALALGVSDRILMFENSCYSVITPEGCASILWKGVVGSDMVDKVAQAADMLHLTSPQLQKLEIVDEIIPEPFGGGHWDHEEAALNLQVSLRKHLAQLRALSPEELVATRYEKFRKIGIVVE